MSLLLLRRYYVGSILLNVLAIVSSLLLIAPIRGYATAAGGSLFVHQDGLDWLEDCRSKGFDPMQLACMTCSRIPSPYQESCQSCCQSYKDAVQPTKPYQAAVLLYTDSTKSDAIIYSGSQSTEVDQLLELDWKDLVEQKGQERLHKMERPESKSDRGSFWLGRAMPAELLFLDQPLRQSMGYQQLMDRATEIVSLHGLSRDDMKDMIRTLLP